MKTSEILPFCPSCENGGAWKSIGKVDDVVKVSYLPGVTVTLHDVAMLECTECGEREFEEWDGPERVMHSKAGDFLVHTARELKIIPDYSKPPQS